MFQSAQPRLLKYLRNIFQRRGLLHRFPIQQEPWVLVSCQRQETRLLLSGEEVLFSQLAISLCSPPTPREPNPSQFGRGIKPKVLRKISRPPLNVMFSLGIKFVDDTLWCYPRLAQRGYDAFFGHCRLRWLRTLMGGLRNMGRTPRSSGNFPLYTERVMLLKSSSSSLLTDAVTNSTNLFLGQPISFACLAIHRMASRSCSRLIHILGVFAPLRAISKTRSSVLFSTMCKK